MTLQVRKLVCVVSLLLSPCLLAELSGCSGGDSTSDDVADGEATDVPGDGDARQDVEDGTTDDVAAVDHDGDGHPQGEDCDDDDATVHPGADETCNDTDDDCDGETDEDGVVDGSDWYADDDRDGYGDPDALRRTCRPPLGHVPNDDDCDDAEAAVNPDAGEVCNGTDDDCDGETDEEGASGATLWYADDDGDGYGAPDIVVEACSLPVGYASLPGDCDDAQATVNPAAAERCSPADTDDDCDGETDEPDAIDAPNWYADADLDGFGDPMSEIVACLAPAGYISDNTDCDDLVPTTFPGALDEPDAWGVDGDCDGIDGVLARSIFVSADSGVAANDGRGELDEYGRLVVRPVQTLEQALALAAAPECGGVCDILMAAGTYDVGDAPAQLLDGTDVFGGYWDADWQHTAPADSTVVTGRAASGVLRADSLTRPTVVGFLAIQGADTTATGESSVAVLVTNTPTSDRLTFLYVTVIAGAGGDGEAGGLPPDPSCTPCLGGASTSDPSTTPYCSPAINGNAAPGAGGSGASCPGAGRGGYLGSGLSGCSCGTASAGEAGVQGADGTRPAGGIALRSPGTWGVFTSDPTGRDWSWSAAWGGDGGTGGRGAGGGGGGCGGTATREGFLCGGGNQQGGYGAAGGAGGCGGGAGQGGGPGGGSFAVVLAGSRMTFGGDVAGDRVVIHLGMGGRGGDGGDGGTGASGAPGSAGGAGQSVSNPDIFCSATTGGRGGDGGGGGNGAGGSGGAAGSGGPSVGVALIGADAGIDLGGDEGPGEENLSVEVLPAGTPGGTGGTGGRTGGSMTSSLSGDNGVEGGVAAEYCWDGAICS